MKLSQLITKSLAAAVSALALSSAMAAGDPERVDFILKAVHKRNFKGCDHAVRETFQWAYGDVRVNTSNVPGLPNWLRVTATFGDKGDSIMQDVSFQQVGKQCFASIASTITFTHGCTEWRSKNQEWKTVGHTPDHEWMENKGGVIAVVRETGGQCTVTYSRQNTF